jgi:hypothetical protein
LQKLRHSKAAGAHGEVELEPGEDVFAAFGADAGDDSDAASYQQRTLKDPRAISQMIASLKPAPRGAEASDAEHSIDTESDLGDLWGSGAEDAQRPRPARGEALLSLSLLLTLSRAGPSLISRPSVPKIDLRGMVAPTPRVDSESEGSLGLTSDGLPSERSRRGSLAAASARSDKPLEGEGLVGEPGAPTPKAPADEWAAKWASRKHREMEEEMRQKLAAATAESIAKIQAAGAGAAARGGEEAKEGEGVDIDDRLIGEHDTSGRPIGVTPRRHRGSANYCRQNCRGCGGSDKDGGFCAIA